MKNKSIPSAIPVAHYFLKIAAERKKAITNLKLQKLVYYAAVWYFTFFNEKLFSDRIEAWMHGPAIPRLYGHFKEFGFNPIVVENVKNMRFPFNAKQEEFLNNIWDVYGKYDAAYLEVLTHSELPWQEARRGLEPGTPSKRIIDIQKAKHYYAARLAASKS